LFVSGLPIFDPVPDLFVPKVPKLEGRHTEIIEVFPYTVLLVFPPDGSFIFCALIHAYMGFALTP